MNRLIYASAIAAILIGIFVPSLRPQRLSFLPKPSMNVTRCTELHNEIVRLGWEGMGRAPEDFQPQTWFEHYGVAAEKARRELSNDLVAFLRGAYVIPDDDYYFHYYVSGMLTPGEHMFAFLDQVCGYEEKMVNMYDGYHRRLESRKLGRYVRLYYATNIVSHSEGLIFDQKTNTAIMCMSIHDSDPLCRPDRLRWYPLEDVLTAWLDMIRIRKVRAVGPDTEFHPWELVPYSEWQLEETVETFNKLTAAIEMKIVNLRPIREFESTIIIDKAALDAAQIPRGFVYDFLSLARRPKFTFIAPGLSIPTPDTIRDQPFGTWGDIPPEHQEWFRIPPLLLFRSSHTYTRPPLSPSTPEEDIFDYPFNLSTYPAGLYFHTSDLSQNSHEDQVSLILPYAIGANGYARTSDGTRFGEKVREELPNSENMYGELYQIGHQPFIEGHAVRLVKVLQSWLAMVERGVWKIGEDGVMNDIDEWKKADTRGGWENYVIPIDW